MTIRMISLVRSLKPPSSPCFLLEITDNVFSSPLSDEADVAEFLRNPVNDHKQHDVDGRVEQADRGAQFVLGVDDALLVDIDGDDVAGGPVQVGLQKVGLFKADAHQARSAHDQLQDDHREQAGDVDVEDALENSGAVHLGRLIQGGVDAGKRGQVDDGPPSGFLPDAAGHIDGAEGACLGQEIDLGPGDQVDEAAGGRKEDAQHAADDHGGDKVRRVDDCLHGALEAFEAELVERKAQKDRHRETPEQAVETQLDGVPQHAVEGGGPEEPFEPFPAHPGTAGDAKARVVVAEGDLDAVHGPVLVHDGDDHRDQKQDIQLPAVRHTPAQAFAVHFGGGDGFCGHKHSSFMEYCLVIHDTFHELF